MLPAYTESGKMNGLTTNNAKQHQVIPDTTQTGSAASLGSAETAEILEKPEDRKVVATANRLDFIDIPNKEPHWKTTHYGEAIIPSPIAVLPKPLALSYRSFYNHYEEHEFIKQEKLLVTYPRSVVGCTLVSTLLRHYFPAQGYAMREVFPGTSTGAEFTPQPVVIGVSIEGTRNWVVKSKSDSAIVIVVVIVTEAKFSMFPGRTLPTQLAVATNFLDSNHCLAVHGDRMSRGVVVLLSNAGTPTKPTFEFYSFDSGHQQKGVMVPIAVQMQDTHSPATNSISLAPEHADQVDRMFKIIARASSGQEAWPQVLPTSSMPTAPNPVLELQPTSAPVVPISAVPSKRKPKSGPKATLAPKTKRTKKIESVGSMPQTPTPTVLPKLPLNPAPTAPKSPTILPATAGASDDSTRHPIDVKNDKTRKMEHHEISEAYVRTVKQNKAGNLIEENGKMIPNGKSKAIRMVAKMMSHAFRPPNHSRIVSLANSG
ncbi:hypothetical protein PMIN07_009939 [Paraphaeosphaeria minitans]